MALHLEALAAIALSLLMAVAWMLQQPHREFRLGRYHLDVLARAGRRRQRAVAAFFPLPPRKGVVT
jgi:hypothetical protein